MEMNNQIEKNKHKATPKRLKFIQNVGVRLWYVHCELSSKLSHNTSETLLSESTRCGLSVTFCFAKMISDENSIISVFMEMSDRVTPLSLIIRVK